MTTRQYGRDGVVPDDEVIEKMRLHAAEGNKIIMGFSNPHTVGEICTFFSTPFRIMRESSFEEAKLEAKGRNVAYNRFFYEVEPAD